MNEMGDLPEGAAGMNQQRIAGIALGQIAGPSESQFRPRR